MESTETGSDNLLGNLDQDIPGVIDGTKKALDGILPYYHLPILVLDPNMIFITEQNNKKNGDKKVFGNTPDSIRKAIISGETSKIPPIIVLKNPFRSIEEAKKEYIKYRKAFPREGRKYYPDYENGILDEILKSDRLLCYNGNRRLAEFQKANLPIKACAISTQEQFLSIPLEEKSVSVNTQLQSRLDQEYTLSFLALLDDVVYMFVEKEYWRNFDSKKALGTMIAKRSQSK